MMEADLYKFRIDLKDGYTIEEALHRNNLSFKYVLENMPRPHCMNGEKPKTVKRKSKTRQYIINHYGKYVIRKSVEGRQQHFGTYDTLPDAIKVRDYCKKHGWRKECIPEYKRRCGVK